MSVEPLFPSSRRPVQGRPPAAAGSEAARAVAEVVRITLLDDAGREDMRDHLFRRHVAGRLGFAALRVAEACPALPVPADAPHPGAAQGTARYRAVVAATGRCMHEDGFDLST